jgi:hypothetical protein
VKIVATAALLAVALGGCAPAGTVAGADCGCTV